MMTEKAQGGPDLAQLRTEWADERTWMAGERTFAAWVRTELSLVAAGLASAKLMSALEPQWLVRAMGAIFIVLGGSIFALGFRTYLDVSKELKEEEIKATSAWFLGILTLMLLVAAVAALVLVFA